MEPRTLHWTAGGSPAAEFRLHPKPEMQGRTKVIRPIPALFNCKQKNTLPPDSRQLKHDAPEVYFGSRRAIQGGVEFPDGVQLSRTFFISDEEAFGSMIAYGIRHMLVVPPPTPGLSADPTLASWGKDSKFDGVLRTVSEMSRKGELPYDTVLQKMPPVHPARVTVTDYAPPPPLPDLMQGLRLSAPKRSPPKYPSPNVSSWGSPTNSIVPSSLADRHLQNSSTDSIQVPLASASVETSIAQHPDLIPSQPSQSDLDPLSPPCRPSPPSERASYASIVAKSALI